MTTHLDESKSPVLLGLEYALLFLITPGLLYFFTTRWNIHGTLWLVALYAAIMLSRTQLLSWSTLWHGEGWSRVHKRASLIRFLAATALLIIAINVVFPERFLSFVLQRPWFWLIVMFLYPILSVLPQEFVFRSFFFRRYERLFPNPRFMVLMSTFSFGLAHIVFHNLVSPFLCLVAGFLFCHSYQQHRSLKWTVIEHAAYGCMVFTIGLGSYFHLGALGH